MKWYKNAWNGKNILPAMKWEVHIRFLEGKNDKPPSWKRKACLRKAGWQNPGWPPLLKQITSWPRDDCPFSMRMIFSVWWSCHYLGIHWVRKMLPPTAPWFSGKWVPPTRAHFAMNHLTMTGQTKTFHKFWKLWNQVDFPTETYWVTSPDSTYTIHYHFIIMICIDDYGRWMQQQPFGAPTNLRYSRARSSGSQRIGTDCEKPPGPRSPVPRQNECANSIHAAVMTTKRMRTAVLF